MKKSNKEKVEDLEKFVDKLKRLIRNSGRSSHISIREIEELMSEYNI